MEHTAKVGFLLGFINSFLPSLSVGEFKLEIWGVERFGILQTKGKMLSLQFYELETAEDNLLTRSDDMSNSRSMYVPRPDSPRRR
jgi:hypothetical protein